MAKRNMAYLSSLKSRAKLRLSSLPVSPSRVLRATGTSSYYLLPKFKKPSKTDVVLLAGVIVSGTPCNRHIIVLFAAEAPSGHVAQAWAIPSPSWGLLSQWHRQQTTTPETNEASSNYINYTVKPIFDVTMKSDILKINDGNSFNRPLRRPILSI